MLGEVVYQPLALSVAPLIVALVGPGGVRSTPMLAVVSTNALPAAPVPLTEIEAAQSPVPPGTTYEPA